MCGKRILSKEEIKNIVSNSAAEFEMGLEDGLMERPARMGTSIYLEALVLGIKYLRGGSLDNRG